MASALVSRRLASSGHARALSARSHQLFAPAASAVAPAAAPSGGHARALATRSQQRGVPTTTAAAAPAAPTAPSSASSSSSFSAAAAAEALFARIEGAVAGGDLAAKNAGFALRRERGGGGSGGGGGGARAALVIETGAAARGGGATIRLEVEEGAGGRVSMLSQKHSGSHATGGVVYYRPRAGDGEFVCESDGHFLVELLTRDLVHQCKGMPVF